MYHLSICRLHATGMAKFHNKPTIKIIDDLILINHPIQSPRLFMQIFCIHINTETLLHAKGQEFNLFQMGIGLWVKRPSCHISCLVEKEGLKNGIYVSIVRSATVPPYLAKAIARQIDKALIYAGLWGEQELICKAHIEL